MIISYILVVLWIILASLIPIFIPIPISLIVGIILNHWNKIWLIGSCILWWLILWISWRYLDIYIQLYIVKIIKRIEDKISNRKFMWTNKENKSSKISSKIADGMIKIKDKLENTNNIYISFLLTVICIQSAIPDAITVNIVRKKFNIFGFMLVFTFGKVITYIPIIFLTEITMNIMQK